MMWVAVWYGWAFTQPLAALRTDMFAPGDSDITRARVSTAFGQVLGIVLYLRQPLLQSQLQDRLQGLSGLSLGRILG